MNFEIDSYNALRVALKEMSLYLTEQSVPEETVFVCKLVADELLGNVLRHGGKRAQFKATVTEREIILCIKDSEEYRPPEKSVLSAVTGECGRGLFLVDNYCSRREFSEEEGIIAVIEFAK